MIELVAQSQPMREAVGLAERVAATDANVLITGESGSGKDAMASFIHQRSKRSSQPFIKIDCATLPGHLLEAELFGYERGAFTGATDAKPGRLEAANRGTLVLDEIAYLATDAQAKLLRVIETRQFERLGGRRTIKVDARIIALTNVNLLEAIGRKNFREDLFYRLNVVHIRMPPLRARRDDLLELATGFVKGYARKHGRKASSIDTNAMRLLEQYDFPGNVRELANTIERAVIVSEERSVNEGHLPDSLRAAVKALRGNNQRGTLAEMEAAYVNEILAATKGNKSEAARILGISRKNLYERISRTK